MLPSIPPLLLLLLLLLLLPSLPSAQDWTLSGLGDPLSSAAAHPGPNRRWKIDWLLSDSFFYPNKTHPNFRRKWLDYNPTGWPGPGATQFQNENVRLENGSLVIVASRLQGGDVRCFGAERDEGGRCDCQECFLTARTVGTGYLSSRRLVRYPSFVEASMRIGRTALSSNFWLKSAQTEIDVNESYGDGANRRVVKTNAHLFFRHVGGERSLNRQQRCDSRVDLSAGFYRYAAHWVNETFVRFYFEGRVIREMELRGEGIVDPTGGYLNEGMRMVFDLEAHAWRREEGVPSDEELADQQLNRMEVDWVRTYYPVDV